MADVAELPLGDGLSTRGEELEDSPLKGRRGVDLVVRAIDDTEGERIVILMELEADLLDRRGGAMLDREPQAVLRTPQVQVAVSPRVEFRAFREAPDRRGRERFFWSGAREELRWRSGAGSRAGRRGAGRPRRPRFHRTGGDE